jgi:hypothetical protein
MARRPGVAPRGAFVASFSLLSAVLIGGGSLHASAPPPIRCGEAPGVREIRLHVLNEAGAPTAAVEAATDEATEIWARAGVRVTFTSPPTPFSLTDGRTVLVIIRRGLAAQPATTLAASAKGKVRRPLGWLTFDAQGRPGSLMEVSLEATTALVQRGMFLDKPMKALPEQAQAAFLGRGLGRVIAHELGHWLMGRGHAELGLMKRSFGTTDLIEPQSPQLPCEWEVEASARTRDSSSY